MGRRVRRVLLALAISGVAAAAAAAGMGAEQGSGCAAELGTRERDVSARPDDLGLGADYRQAAIRCKAVDRSIDFFERLAKEHRQSLSAQLNLAFAYVDKIPTSGDLRQALLGRDAVGEFGKAIAIRPTWVAHYTRGFIYLNYPRVIGVGRKAIADFERALAIQNGEPPRPYHARTYVALGDAHYWRFSDLAKARQIWAEGLAKFPEDEPLRARMAHEGMPLRDIIRKTMNADARIDTSLAELK